MDNSVETTKSFDGPNGNLYTELTALREEERAKSIKLGLIDDPEKPKALEEARAFRGTCQDMCPRYEREQREYQNDVKRWEINPQTRRIDVNLAVKAFHRPAAGNEQALPSDVRPPEVLQRTLDYLVRNIVSPCDPLDKDTHGFVRDRTRSIRQDFTIQNERGRVAIECHERIVRFHILSLHHMCQVDGFDAHQEMEQLRKTLQSLAEYYDDQRLLGEEHPTEAEFRAYHILTRLRDPDILRHVQALPSSLRRSPQLAQSLRLYQAAQRSNEEVGRFKPPNCEGSLNLYSKFFKILHSAQTNYLMACICETHFNDIRKGCLKAMRKSFIPAVKAPRVDEFMEMLGCDDELEVETQCEQYGIIVRHDEDGILRPVLNKSTQFDETRPDMKQKFSHRFVESKRNGRSFEAIINAAESSKETSFSISNEVTSIPFKDAPQSKSVSSGQTCSDATPLQKKASPFTFTQPKAPEPSQPVQPTTSGFQFKFSQPSAPQTQSILPKNQGATHSFGPVTSAGVAPNDIPISSEDSKITKTATFEPIVSKPYALSAKQQEDQRKSELEAQSKAEEESFQQWASELRDTLSKNLLRGLIRDRTMAVIHETYADEWCKKRIMKTAWAAIRRAVDKVQRQRQQHIADEAARVKRQEEYAKVFEALQNIEPPRKRKRSRPNSYEGVATSESILHARQVADNFWKALDLDRYLSKVQFTARSGPWTLLISTTSEDPNKDWLAGKFDLTDGKRKIESPGCAVNIVMQATSELQNCGQIGAMIFLAQGDGDQMRLLAQLQQIAETSDYYFPLLVLKIAKIDSEDELADELMIPRILNDKKSPVNQCHFVGVETLEDVKRFEDGLHLLFSGISDRLNPLALQRQEELERGERRRLVDFQALRATFTPIKKSYSSFYDPAVLPMQTIPKVEIPKEDNLVIPNQVKELYKTIQRAQEIRKGLQSLNDSIH